MFGESSYVGVSSPMLDVSVIADDADAKVATAKDPSPPKKETTRHIDPLALPRAVDAGWALRHAPPRAALELIVGPQCVDAVRTLAAETPRETTRP